MIVLKPIKTALIFALIGQAAAMLILAGLAALLLKAEDPKEHLTLCACAAALLTSGISGALCALFCRESPVLAGALCGLLLSLISLALSLIPGGEKPLYMSLLLLALEFLPALLASFLLSKKPGGKRKNGPGRRKQGGRGRVRGR